MNAEHHIVQSVFVKTFYKSNTTFFLLVIGLCGGFMRSQDHIAVAELFVSSPFLLMIPITIWSLYALKVIQFNQSILTHSENEFIFNFNVLPASTQWLALLTVLASQLLPVIFYGIFLIAMSTKLQLPTSIILIVIAILVLLVLASKKLQHALHHPNQDRSVSRLKRIFDTSFTKPFFMFFIEWIVRRQPLLVIGTKLFSAAVLLAVTYLYSTDVYDDRLLGMAIIISTTAGAQLMGEMHRFDNFYFAMLRQLPINFLKRFLYTSVTILLISLPEIGLLITYFPQNLSRMVIPESIVFMISVCVFIYGNLYAKKKSLEELMPLIFILAMLSIVLILFKIPMLVLAIINLLWGLFIWQKHYYGFEYVAKQKTPTL